MAGESQVQPAPHAVAGDRGINARGEGLNRRHQYLTSFRELIGVGAVESRNLFQLSACREELIVSSDDQRSSFVGKFADRLGKRQHTPQREPIGSVRRLKAQDEYALPLFDLEGTFRHKSILEIVI